MSAELNVGSNGLHELFRVGLEWNMLLVINDSFETTYAQMLWQPMSIWPLSICIKSLAEAAYLDLVIAKLDTAHVGVRHDYLMIAEQIW